MGQDDVSLSLEQRLIRQEDATYDLVQRMAAVEQAVRGVQALVRIVLGVLIGNMVLSAWVIIR